LAKQPSTWPNVSRVRAKAVSTAASSPTSHSSVRILRPVGAPDGDIRAGLGHCLSHAQADAAVAAGHQRDFAAQIEWAVRHGMLPSGISSTTLYYPKFGR
jgi:hypothetical protein